jgi:ribosome-associated protein
MVKISETLEIPDGELIFESIRASGPGGQNVNKVSSAVQLRFDVRSSPALTPALCARLERLAGTRLTHDGVLLLRGERFRTQEQNRADVLARFIALVQKAAVPPRPRHRTRPTQASREKRLAQKRTRSALKQTRTKPTLDKEE